MYLPIVFNYTECGDVEPDVYLQAGDEVILTSYNYPFQEYTNSLNCHWMFTVNPGYRVFVHFNAFSLEPYFDFLTITGTDHFYPSVSYTGYTLPPDIESPSSFIFISFETDGYYGALGFSLTVSVAPALGKIISGKKIYKEGIETIFKTSVSSVSGGNITGSILLYRE